MMKKMISPVGVPGAILWLAAALTGQQTAPRFDVASIRPVPANAPPLIRDRNFSSVMPGGRYDDPRVTLASMIALAYDVKNVSTQLAGVPKWAEGQVYSVSAKAAEDFPTLSPAENREQVRLMVRAMLADRFHLQLHTETREERVYNLEVAKGGLKIKEVEAPAPPAKADLQVVMSDTSGRMMGKKSTMTYLASALTNFLKRPVIDRTGLAGYYDFDVHWSAVEAPNSLPPTPGLGAEGIALLLSNFESLTGLRLSPAAGPVEIWVIDHVEPPSAN